MDQRLLANLLIAANIIAFFYGVYYYGDQLSQTNPLLWILVIDCPLQALLFAIVLTLADAGKDPGLLVPFTAVGSIKYGLWTMFVILFQADYFLVGAAALLYVGLFIAHIGQFLEGLFLSGIEKIGPKAAIGILLLYLLNDYSDYVWNTHPFIPDTGLGTVAAVTVALSFLSVAFVYVAGRMDLDAFRRIRILKGLRELVKRPA